MDGLIIVDLQNDFCPSGALPVPDGDDVVEPLNRLAEQVQFVVATRDWHPPDHASFKEQGGPWPAHCVRDTWGAQLHPKLHMNEIDAIVDAGRERDEEGYSGFEHTDLEQLLREHGVYRVHIGGLALDYCVRATALDARRAGFDVVLHLGATRAINVEPSDDERTLDELRGAAVEVVD